MIKIPRTSQLNYFTEQLKSNPESMMFPPALPPPKSWKSEQYNTLWGRKKPFPLWNVIGIETSALIQPAGRQNQILFQTRGEKGRGGEVWNQEKWIHLLQKIKAHCTWRPEDCLVLITWGSRNHSAVFFTILNTPTLQPRAWHFRNQVKCNVYTEARLTTRACFCRKMGMKWFIMNGWEEGISRERMSHLEYLSLKE